MKYMEKTKKSRSARYGIHKVKTTALILTFILTFMFIMMLTPQTFATPGDIDNDGITDSKEKELANKYAPVLYFEKGERLFPTSIEYYLENCNLNQSRSGDDLIKSAPINVSDISTYTDSNAKYYLDNTLGGINDTKIMEDYEDKKSSLGYIVYCRVTGDIYNGKTYFVIQYWFFYVFNPGTLNQHEGDWEMIQVILNSEENPEFVAYSQHMGGERANWADINKDGDYPNVYIALNSHANYIRSYEGAVGLANDKVSDDGLVLKLGDYSITMLGEKGSGNHEVSQGWIEFAGNWGEYGGEESGILGERGPHGPAYREDGRMWDEPIAWSMGLMRANSLWFGLNWIVYNFILVFSLIIVVTLIICGFGILKKHRSTGLGPKKVSMLYVDKFDLKSMGNILGMVSIIVAIFALFYPWYYINADVATSGISTGGTVNLVSIDGLNGVLVNWFMSEGIIQMFGLAIPFSIIIGAGFALFILSTVGLNSSSKLGRKYISRGIRNAVPVIIILIVIVLLGSIVSLIAPGLSGQLPPEALSEATDIFNAIGKSPLSGELSKDISQSAGSPQTINLAWGMGSGGYMLIASAAIGMIAGVLEIIAHTQFFKSKKEEMQKKPG